MRCLASKRRRGGRGVRAGAVAGALVLLAVAGGAAAEPDPTYPNAPKYGQGFAVAYDTATLSYAAPSKQWLRIPNLRLAASVFALTSHPGGVSSTCLQRYGAQCTPAPGAEDRIFTDALAYPVVSLPANPRDAHFDAFPDVTVRTVAFGSIPAEATLSLTLPLGPDGLPIGLHAVTVTDEYQNTTTPPPPGINPNNGGWTRSADTPASGGVWVSVKTLSVDGVPIDIGDHCRTAQLATLDLMGKGYTIAMGDPEPAGTFSVSNGGTMHGTIDVPRFADCGAGGDDLSPLVSSVASGHDFPVEAETGTFSAHCWGAIPANIDWTQCPAAPDLPIPTAAP